MMQDVFVTLTESPNNPPLQLTFGTKTGTALEKAGVPNFRQVGPWHYEENPIIAVLLNNELKSLSDPIEYHGKLTPVRLFSEYGKRMYRHSLSYLLTMAARFVVPEREIVIGHTLGDGYYFSFSDDVPVPGDFVDIKVGDIVDQLREAMKEISTAAIPIRRIFAAYDDAVDWFSRAGRNETVLLLRYRNQAAIPLYSCGEYRDIAFEPLLPNTSLLTWFELQPYGSEGMLLRYPRSSDPLSIAPFADNPVIFSIFREYKQWGSILSADSIGKLNLLCEERQIGHFIQVAESLQNKKISRIADAIGERKTASGLKAILIAGPSSSGKTTFARKLSIQLRVLGLIPIPISLDDYYRNRPDVPLDAEGNPDLEALEALDIERLNQDLLELQRTGAAEIPQFDFTIAARKPEGIKVVLPENGILILEGIHGLNPDLTPLLPGEAKFRIYISALTQLNIDRHNRISTTDNRIIRRIVRDHQFRGMNAAGTLDMWPSVHEGEKINIFPYQNEADVAFNSALDYELAVLKTYAEPLLKTVKPSDNTYWHAIRLLTFLDGFYPVPADMVPADSLLREFIGGSLYYR